VSSVDGPHALLVLQEHDTELDQLRHRRTHLPQRSRLDQVGAELRTVETEGAALTAERDDLARRQAQLEAELGDLAKRRTDIDGRMRSGDITASRDLQAMADQLTSLKRREGDLEDAELEIMEAIEPKEARLAALQERWAELDREGTELRRELTEAEVTLDAQLEGVLAARQAAAAAVPPELMAIYDRLRGRLGGVGAAALVGASCGGCHLTLSASELDRIRRLPEDAVVTCDQCGRILVR
jgi:uncharacterized protein